MNTTDTERATAPPTGRFGVAYDGDGWSVRIGRESGRWWQSRWWIVRAERNGVLVDELGELTDKGWAKMLAEYARNELRAGRTPDMLTEYREARAGW